MKISIVIPSLDQMAFLGETLESVLSQEGDFEVEAVVVDGGSTDGTLDLLEAIDDPRVRWSSESDTGQSNAINKGLDRATGHVIGWLNSDDLYVPGTLAAVADVFREQSEAKWLFGRCVIIDDGGRVIRPMVTRYKDRRVRRYTYRRLLRENFISQMTVFWRRVFGDAVGPLDESLHYTMDYDLWCRMGARADPVVLDRVLARFRLYAGSKSGAVQRRRQFDEEYEVALRYLGDDHVSRLIHRVHVEKTVWAYRLMRILRVGQALACRIVAAARRPTGSCLRYA